MKIDSKSTLYDHLRTDVRLYPPRAFRGLPYNSC
nr:MAG TPA: hypothetical protein [Caudoviricetes sp.]